MSISWDDRDIQYPSGSVVRFAECHRAARKEAKLANVEHRSEPTRDENDRCITFCTQWIASNLAPVDQALLDHTRKGSSNAVKRLARSGVSRRLNSPSVRVQTMDATTPPADVPDITRGIRPASRKAFTTPK